MNTTAVNCPVDGIKVNESKVRTIAFFILVLAGGYLLTDFWVIPALMGLDFALRAFNVGKWSPLGWLGERLVKTLRFPVLLIDQAPKRFAAGVGLLFSIAILTFQLVGLNTLFLTSMLMVFAALEAFAGFCAGCQVYTLLQVFLAKKQR